MDCLPELKDFLKPEVLAATFAAIAAGISGFVAWRQHVWNKRTHIASVKPFIVDHLAERDAPLSLTYILANEGLGPALIDSLSVTWDGEKITMDDLQAKAGQQVGKAYGVQIGEFGDTFAIGAGRTFVLLHVFQNADPQNLYRKGPSDIKGLVDALVAHCRIKVTYKSLLSNELQTFETKLTESLVVPKGPKD